MLNTVKTKKKEKTTNLSSFQVLPSYILIDFISISFLNYLSPLYSF